jgi:putative NADPH-quinone reductase
MPKRITIIEGHPDVSGERFGHALANAYATGAAKGGHEVRRIAVGSLDFGVLRTREEWENGAPANGIRQTQQDIAWADHLVILYPLWLGTMPALLKAFFEQTFRPGFAIGKSDGGKAWSSQLKGKSARIVVTMGMPALLYRWYFGAHSLKSLERNILGFVGIGPIRTSLIGMVEAKNDAKRTRWLEKLRALGRQAR